jgi:hypothetical protein
VAGLVPIALDRGARVVIINGAPTEFDEFSLCVRGEITETLPALLGS